MIIHRIYINYSTCVNTTCIKTYPAVEHAKAFIHSEENNNARVKNILE